MNPPFIGRGRRRACRRLLLLALSTISTAAFGQADSPEKLDHSQMDHGKMDHGQMEHSRVDRATPAPAAKPAPKRPKRSQARPAIDHSQHDTGGHAGHTSAMPSAFGPYVATRDASGTSWQPDLSPHEGIHQQLAEWSVMSHGWVNLNYARQDGPRGANQSFVTGMLMTMAQRQLGDGTLGVRAMMSPEPFMGPNGYPLLLATGETADGRSHLIDRQHPHELFMELAATYSYTLSKTTSVFIYGGLPGEPALGPPAFMHRTSGMDNPEAPISHHWLDSTHITFGVITLGTVIDNWKFEASTFRGREPDQYRYDIERPWLDSFSGRVSWNPTREWSMQVSYGHLNSPEQLAPLINEDRVTASAIYTTPFGDGHLWSSTASWGRKITDGKTLDAFLFESSAILKQNVTLFMRAERVDQSELTHHMAGLEGRAFTVSKVSAGGIYDFLRTDHAKFGVGGLASRYVLPEDLKPLYGRDLTSFMLFARLKII
ncbi:MAG: hypothetical protein EON84_16270 [Bradyrhizobiaceae bacterium]|nr:MAG: hypothetical protein EON84_16270 [Bradyrhizobiaceae bacterium]